MRNSHQPSLHPIPETDMARRVTKTHINHLYIPSLRQTWPVESPMRNSHQPPLHTIPETDMTRGVTKTHINHLYIPSLRQTWPVKSPKLTSTISTYHPWDRHGSWSHQNSHQPSLHTIPETDMVREVTKTHINHLYIPSLRQTWPVKSPKLTSTISTYHPWDRHGSWSHQNSHQPSLHTIPETDMARRVTKEKLTSTISTPHPWDSHVLATLSYATRLS